MIYLHPAFVQRAGAGDIQRHFQLLGYEIRQGRKHLVVERKEDVWTRTQTTLPDTSLSAKGVTTTRF